DLNAKDNYQLQKATTNFGGREWIAWFASEISVQDGPYKFYKLPGLIVELYDTKKDYLFSLINIKKKDHIFSSSLFKNLGIQTYKVDYKKYKKIESKFHKKPGAAFRQYMSSMGIEIPNSEVKNFSKKTKERLNKRNNTIELNKNV
ncbi:MAG: GLPGLI family protein, partial [Flavobacteriaceae bacterium]